VTWPQPRNSPWSSTEAVSKVEKNRFSLAHRALDDSGAVITRDTTPETR
jgi:hypothetical protein